MFCGDQQRIAQYATTDLKKIMEDWCVLHDGEFTGGKMRECRGTGIEDLVIKIIQRIASRLQIDLVAKKGKFDKKKLVVPENHLIHKLHQVDVHVYLNRSLVAVVECKSYLDSCYYVRACEDFELFKKFGYPVKTVIFSLEDSMDEKTKQFTDFWKNNVCDEVFYMLDGKRSSSKPIYRRQYTKEPREEKMMRFVSFLVDLVGHSSS
jgi:hypothetical protein